MVFLLCLLTVGAVLTGWYSQSHVSTLLSGAGASSAAQAVEQHFSTVTYVYAGLLALAVLAVILLYYTLSRAVLRPLDHVSAQFEQIAAGDLTQRIEVVSDNEIGALYLALKRVQDSLVRVVGTVRMGMNEIQSGSQHIVAGNSDLSTRTEQQAAALQQTAASMEQLASTVKQNADNARQANQLAATASEVAQRGGQAVGEVVTTMEGISSASRKISDIVGVIDSIAFQTNILALNAAVEAARAGEQGKGFAVVASEVRALAQRSAQAAKEIKQLIEDSVRQVSEGSVQVERAGATMQEIVDSVARVTDIMGEISAATTEQSSGIDQINRAVTQMDHVTQQNAVLVQDAAASAVSLSEQVNSISSVVAGYKLLANQIIDVPAKQVASSPRRAPALDAGHKAEAPKPAAAPSAAAALGHNGAAPAAAERSRRAPPPAQRPSAAAPEPSAGKASYVMKTPGASKQSNPADDEWVEF
ncbi:MAG: methyl-accepting chemotaxis protein [Alcaligenaceae bacterium]|nr:methyl-accepting chemotaxis protein [Alcaligenaceae bacterium]